MIKAVVAVDMQCGFMAQECTLYCRDMAHRIIDPIRALVELESAADNRFLHPGHARTR